MSNMIRSEMSEKNGNRRDLGRREGDGKLTVERIAARVAESSTAAALAVLVLPVIAVAAALSLFYFRAWPFFVHDRIGLGGRRFRFLKIRTLPPATDRYTDKYSLARVQIPPMMQVVRRLHLDELPQLLHVVTGKMSFVGPRPEMPQLHSALAERFATERTSVRPGLTCLWQISPHSAGLIGECPEYDHLYVQHRNARLDLWIMAQTIRKVTRGRTIHLHELPRWTVGPAVAARVLEQAVPDPDPAATATLRPSLSLID